MGASCHPCLRINEDTIQYNTIHAVAIEFTRDKSSHRVGPIQKDLITDCYLCLIDVWLLRKKIRNLSNTRRFLLPRDQPTADDDRTKATRQQKQKQQQQQQLPIELSLCRFHRLTIP